MLYINFNKGKIMARKNKTGVEERTQPTDNTQDVNSVKIVDGKESGNEKETVNKKVTLNTVKTIDELNKFLGDKAKIARVIVENYKIAINKHKDDKMHLVSAKFDLFNGIKNIINNKDYNVFKVNFDYINRVFVIDGEKEFNHISLSMYDYLWNFGSDSRVAFQLTTKLISTLADPKNRKANKDKVKNIFKFYTDTGVANLSRYYGV